MAIAFDAYSSPGATSTGTLSWTHTPVGTPRAVFVGIADYITLADNITSVTYGGVAMSPVALSPLARDSTNDGVIHGYFLGSSIPTGAQTIEITEGSASSKMAYAVTCTAGADTVVQDTTTINTTAIGDVTGTLSLGGNSCFCAEVWGVDVGLVTRVTELTGWTSREETDAGAQVSGFYTYNTVGTSDVTFGVNINTDSRHVVTIGVAITEDAGATYTLDAAAASYAYTASDASLEFGRTLAPEAASYAYTASDASLEFGYQLVADTIAYDWTVADASLEYTPAGTTYTLIADSAAYLWGASDVDFTYVSLARPQLTYGAGVFPKDYEARVRAHYERQEELDRRRAEEERKERERGERVKEAQRQLADLEKRKKLDSKKSAVAKRRAKLAREIEDLERQQDDARELIAQLVEQINAMVLEQSLLADRRRRMVLLLAAVA